MILATQEQKKTRIDICKTCDKFFNSLHMCAVCGCYMDIKAAVRMFKCPLDKWGKINGHK